MFIFTYPLKEAQWIYGDLPPQYGDTVNLKSSGQPDIPFKYVGFNPISDSTATIYYAF
jgi:hypothetical protein